MKSLKIIKRPSLTLGQKELLSLIESKVENGDRILFAEAESIYVSRVCREVREGIPHTYNYWIDNGEGKSKGGFEPMPKEMVVNRVIMWLTCNIGALVLKGYLKVMPIIEFNP